MPGDLSSWAVTVMIHHLLENPLTLFFGTGLTSLGSRITLSILGWQSDFGAELVGLNEGVPPFDSLIWNQFVHVFSCGDFLTAFS